MSGNNPNVTFPSIATVVAGQRTVTFSAVVAAISDSESALITAQGSNNVPVSFERQSHARCSHRFGGQFGQL